MRVSKSRKGVALIVAMSVVLIGGLIIALTFNMVYTHGWLSEAQKDTYTNHTTLLSVMQAVKGRIIAENEAIWETQHAPGLRDDGGAAPANGSLTLADLRFDNWSYQKKSTNTDLGIGGGGVGLQYVDVDVYDMYYRPEWIKQDELRTSAYFPPPLDMTKSGVVSDNGTSLGETTHDGAGDSDDSTAGNIDPKTYGAYLIRARLFDNQATPRLVRTMEEAFVQILPPKPSP